MPVAASEATTEPAEVPTMKSACAGSQPVASVSANSAPTSQAPPRMPPPPRTSPIFGRVFGEPGKLRVVLSLRWPDIGRTSAYLDRGTPPRMDQFRRPGAVGRDEGDLGGRVDAGVLRDRRPRPEPREPGRGGSPRRRDAARGPCLDGHPRGRRGYR